MNAFQHYISDIARHPMCLLESSKDLQAQQSQAASDRRADLLETLASATMTSTELRKIAGYSHGQMAHMLRTLKDDGKVIAVAQVRGKPTLWRRA